jgi:hypothetical protein
MPFMVRRILTVIVADSVEQPRWILVPRSMAVLDLLERLTNAQASGGDSSAGTRAPVFQFYDWKGRSLPPDVLVAEVPTPGIVIAVQPTGKMSRLVSSSAEVNVWLFRQTLMRDETSSDRLGRFLASPDATVPGAPVKQIDVFVSYSFLDGTLAERIVRLLESRGLQVFLAESSLNTGRQWREQVRDAVRSSRRAVLLITATSVHSTWVLAEAGALASQRTPTIVLLDGVQTADLPAPLRKVSLVYRADEPERWLSKVDFRADTAVEAGAHA